jgi:hypothetical protein
VVGPRGFYVAHDRRVLDPRHCQWRDLQVRLVESQQGLVALRRRSRYAARWVTIVGRDS